MLHTFQHTFFNTPSMIPWSFGVRRATAKSGSRRYCKPPLWLLCIWAWCSVGIASNCLLFLRNESPIPTHQHKQAEEIRHLILSRGKWDPVFASKKKVSRIWTKREEGSWRYFFESPAYVSGSTRPGECDSRRGNGLWYELAPLNRAALNGAWPLTGPRVPKRQGDNALKVIMTPLE